MSAEGRRKRAIPEVLGNPHPLVAWLKRHEAHDQIRGRCQSGLPYVSVPLYFTLPKHKVKAK